MRRPHRPISHLNPPKWPGFLASSLLEVALRHPGLASCQTCPSARVNDTVSVTLGKRGLGQARLLPRLPQRLTTVHVRVVS